MKNGDPSAQARTSSCRVVSDPTQALRSSCIFRARNRPQLGLWHRGMRAATWVHGKESRERPKEVGKRGALNEKDAPSENEETQKPPSVFELDHVGVVVDAHGVEFAQDIFAEEAVKLDAQHLAEAVKVHDGHVLTGPGVIG
jgi:hypothetical protein